MPVTGNKSLLNYSLSIRLCADGFSFLVYSLGSGQLLLQESLPCAADETLADALERGLQLPRIAGRHYERVVLYSTSPSTRVPLDEFRREDMLAVYRLTFAGMSPLPGASFFGCCGDIHTPVFCRGNAEESLSQCYGTGTVRYDAVSGGRNAAGQYIVSQYACHYGRWRGNDSRSQERPVAFCQCLPRGRQCRQTLLHPVCMEDPFPGCLARFMHAIWCRRGSLRRVMPVPCPCGYAGTEYLSGKWKQ